MAAIRNSSRFTLLHRRAKVKRHQFQQFLVLQLGQLHLRSTFEKIPRQLLLRLDQLVDFILDSTLANELVHQYVFGLSDAEGTVGGLVLNLRIPPPVEMDDMRGRREIEPGAARLGREYEERDALIVLEATHEVLSLLHLR